MIELYASQRVAYTVGILEIVYLSSRLLGRPEALCGCEGSCATSALLGCSLKCSRLLQGSGELALPSHSNRCITIEASGWLQITESFHDRYEHAAAQGMDGIQLQ